MGNKNIHYIFACDVSKSMNEGWFKYYITSRNNNKVVNFKKIFDKAI